MLRYFLGRRTDRSSPALFLGEDDNLRITDRSSAALFLGEDDNLRIRSL